MPKRILAFITKLNQSHNLSIDNYHNYQTGKLKNKSRLGFISNNHKLMLVNSAYLKLFYLRLDNLSIIIY